MSITLDDVSCLMHLSIRGRLLDHGRIIRDEAVEMMVTYLGSDLGDSMKEVEDTLGCHDRFVFLDRLYNQQLTAVSQTTGDDERVMQHKAYSLRAYLLYLVVIFFFV
ncbi:unnamed protein product [Lathyrus oleraceus]